MNDVERWLHRQAAREQRGVLLEEALLADRLWQYTRYRLRYFFAKYFVETAVHTATVLFLFLELEWRNFLPIVLAHSATSLASSFWWGALEGLRGQVRDLHRSGKPHRIARTIGGWLTLAWALAAAALLLALGWSAWHAVRGSFGAGEAYIAALLLRLALDFPARCYHSGVYALRRVYKPLPTVLGPELLGLAAILALWPFVGLWALVIAALLLTATLTTVSFHYTGRVYRFIGFMPGREVSVTALRPALRGLGREALEAGAANAAIALDSLVVLALLYGAAADSPALVVFFLAAPSIRAGADWARLYYFDLKRLELRLFTNLRRRFERHTAQLAWLLGAVFWALATVITIVFYGPGSAMTYVALLAFFLARSLLARVQVQAFAEAAYAPVLVTGVVLVAGVGVLSVLAGGETGRLAAVAAVTVASAAALSQLRRRARSRGDPGAALLTLEWLHRLGEVNDAVRVGSARMLPASGPERLDARTLEDRTRWRLAQIAERAARRLGDRGAAAWIGPDRLVWFESAEPPPVVTTQWLQLSAGGLIAEVLTRECGSGEEALLLAGKDALLGPASSHLLTAILPVDVAAARRRFAELFPSGAVYSPDEPVPAWFSELPKSELRAILADAVAFARDLRLRRRRSRYNVTALCAGGELRLIFVTDLRTAKKARGRWRYHVTQLNVRAAIGGARRPLAEATRLPRLSLSRGPTAPIDALRRVPLLAELRPRELQRVAAAMTQRVFAAGAEITTEGQAGVGFFVIAEGRATVTRNGVQVAELGPGDHFGEIALIAETPRMATVTALTDLRCHRMASWEFRRLIEGNASISWQVLQATAKLLDGARREEVAPAATPVAAGTRPPDVEVLS